MRAINMLFFFTNNTRSDHVHAELVSCRVSFLVTLRGNSCVSLVLRWEYNKSFFVWVLPRFSSFFITWLHDYCIKQWGRWFGNLSLNGQVLIHFASLVSKKSQDFFELRASFAKLMYTDVLSQAQALSKCHANANISVPLVM